MFDDQIKSKNFNFENESGYAILQYNLSGSNEYEENQHSRKNQDFYLLRYSSGFRRLVE